MVDYNIISTGSKGNAVIIEKSILIDCGVPFKSLQPFMRDLKLVLLTHVHGDHFNPATVKKLAELRPTLRWVCGEWMVLPLIKVGVDKKRIDVMATNCEYRYARLIEEALGYLFPPESMIYTSITPHDVYHDVPNRGYSITLPNKNKVFYCTDAANLDGITAKNYDLYLIEGNYGNEEIAERISGKKVDGKYIYERRAKEYHLSKEQAQDFIARNAGPDSRYVYLHEHYEPKGERDV